MSNLRIGNYFDTEKIFLGLADTINPNASMNESQIVPKIVVLEKKSQNRMEPIKPYEYHNVNKVIPIASYMKDKEIGWFISMGKIEEVLERTGLEEAKVLDIEPREKVLKKAA